MNRRSGHLRRRSRRKNGDRWQIRGAITPPAAEPDWSAFETHLQHLETAVQGLRQRFDQLRHWQDQQHQIQQQLQRPDLPADELQRLRGELDELEVQLDSALFDWKSLQEPFWQAVRFGGLGVVIGWILRAIAHP